MAKTYNYFFLSRYLSMINHFAEISNLQYTIIPTKDMQLDEIPQARRIINCDIEYPDGRHIRPANYAITTHLTPKEFEKRFLEYYESQECHDWLEEQKFNKLKHAWEEDYKENPEQETNPTKSGHLAYYFNEQCEKEDIEAALKKNADRIKDWLEHKGDVTLSIRNKSGECEGHSARQGNTIFREMTDMYTIIDMELDDNSETGYRITDVFLDIESYIINSSID